VVCEDDLWVDEELLDGGLDSGGVEDDVGGSDDEGGSDVVVIVVGGVGKSEDIMQNI
jgi:hypothetical protein